MILSPTAKSATNYGIRQLHFLIIFLRAPLEKYERSALVLSMSGSALDLEKMSDYNPDF